MCNVQQTCEKMLNITEFKSKPQDTRLYFFKFSRGWQFSGNIRLLIYTGGYVKVTLSCEKLRQLHKV